MLNADEMKPMTTTYEDVNELGENAEPDIPDSNLVRAHQGLRSAIISGELAPGAVLSQVQLAQLLGVSRTPLREALRLLEMEGLVEARHNLRVRVAKLSSADLEQLYVLRIVNEASAVQTSVPRMTEDDLSQLQVTLTQMSERQRAGDEVGWEEAHRRFHHLLVKHAGNRVVRLLTQLGEHSERYRRVLIRTVPRAWQQGESEHAAICEACVNRDAARAAELLAHHLGRTALSLLMVDSLDYDAAALRTAIRASSFR